MSETGARGLGMGRDDGKKEPEGLMKKRLRINSPLSSQRLAPLVDRTAPSLPLLDSKLKSPSRHFC
jgi:hypothetical protein